ncbi:hypothetical protein EVJ58_g4633 [Rhodofomes roseus]|uniref:Uncharacterized protein n=1 Tax=Rhodofomes roseus TaxID=34475 RepID=A0A4Y9YHQ4_9APHY|nr:hypothetical protein EVJ58_g4633 [Rhodofomes roseus]
MLPIKYAYRLNDWMPIESNAKWYRYDDGTYNPWDGELLETVDMSPTDDVFADSDRYTSYGSDEEGEDGEVEYKDYDEGNYDDEEDEDEDEHEGVLYEDEHDEPGEGGIAFGEDITGDCDGNEPVGNGLQDVENQFADEANGVMIIARNMTVQCVLHET